MQALILTGILQSLILSLIAYGIMIPLRLLNFAGLTAEGTYPLGGAICASLMVMQVHPLLALMIAVLVAGLVGIATAFIHLKYQVNTLLVGIILSTMLYSIDLHVMKKPNIALFNTPVLLANYTIFSKILILLSILMLLIIPLYLFLSTELGLQLRAVGFNAAFAKKQGIRVWHYTLFGLFLGNAFNGLAGSLIIQLQNYMDINMGVGIVIHGLAALMIGECIVNNTTLKRQLLSPFIGAIGYQQIQGLAISFGLAHSDIKLLTGAMVFAVIVCRGKVI
jgi:putative tryptophan/tyrosine transport system permease protein